MAKNLFDCTKFTTDAMLLEMGAISKMLNQMGVMHVHLRASVSRVVAECAKDGTTKLCSECIVECEKTTKGK